MKSKLQEVLKGICREEREDSIEEVLERVLNEVGKYRNDPLEKQARCERDLACDTICTRIGRLEL